MYKYLRRMLGVADSVGEVTYVFVGDLGKDLDVINLRGITEDGKKYSLEMTIQKEESKDGT